MNFFVAVVLSWSVIDGDTIAVSARAWPNIIVEERIRLDAVDTAELHAKSACERALALKAKEFTTTKLRAAKTIKVFTTKRDSFGRIIGNLVLDDEDLGAALLAAKLARVYGTQSAWC